MMSTPVRQGSTKSSLFGARWFCLSDCAPFWPTAHIQPRASGTRLLWTRAPPSAQMTHCSGYSRPLMFARRTSAGPRHKSKAPKRDRRHGGSRRFKQSLDCDWRLASAISMKSCVQEFIERAEDCEKRAALAQNQDVSAAITFREAARVWRELARQWAEMDRLSGCQADWQGEFPIFCALPIV